VSAEQREAIIEVTDRVYHDHEWFIDALENLVVGEQRQLIDLLIARFKRSGHSNFTLDQAIQIISVAGAELSTKWYGD
jgi:hypothetical protein